MSTVHLINGTQYTIHANAKSLSTAAAISSYLETAEGGPFRFVQFCDKACNLIATLGTNYAEYLKGASKEFRAGWSMTILPSLPGFFSRFIGALGSLASKTPAIPGAFVRKWITAVQESASLCSAVAYTVLPFIPKGMSCEKLLQGAGVTTLIADSCDLVKNAQDGWTAWAVAAKVEDPASAEFQEAITATRTFHMLKVAKSVCSISGFILGLSAISAYFSKVPGHKIIAAAVSLAGTIFSMGAGVYEKGLMKYERVKFFDPKHVVCITPMTTAPVKKEVTV